MQHLYKILLFCFFIIGNASIAQITRTDTSITTIDADLVNIFNQKVPKKYKIAEVKVLGNRFFDESLLISIAGLNVGDEVTIPGGDNFAKSITKLWGQNYFSNIEIFITKLEGKNISIEIAVTERPRLAKFNFIGIPKGQAEDLSSKTGLIVGRVVTENMKLTATEAIKKFYSEKGFQNAKVKIEEKPDKTLDNALQVNFIIEKALKYVLVILVLQAIQ